MSKKEFSDHGTDSPGASHPSDLPCLAPLQDSYAFPMVSELRQDRIIHPLVKGLKESFDACQTGLVIECSFHVNAPVICRKSEARRRLA